MIIFGFYGTFLPFGFLGILGFAVVGLLWALFLGFIANQLMRREAWRERLANASLFVSIIAIGLMVGGGAMYIFMMSAVLDEPSTTYAALSALMQPSVPFYILINTLLELFIMLFVVFFNWDVDRRRRSFSLIGAGLYLVMRIWTYLVYAETRLAISTQTLSAADVEWFKRTPQTIGLY
jgi:amino acid transporter